MQNQITSGQRINVDLKCVCLRIHQCQASVSDLVSFVTWTHSNILLSLAVSLLPMESTGNWITEESLSPLGNLQPATALKGLNPQPIFYLLSSFMEAIQGEALESIKGVVRVRAWTRTALTSSAAQID